MRATGVPLRRALRAAFEQASEPEDDGKRHLFAFGGSLGAQQINDALLASAPHLDPAALRIAHQTGRDEQARVAEAWRAAGFDADVVAFEDDMPSRYRWADLVVCRAGAISVAELALAGRPALLVPLAHVGGGEQAANARELERAGAALVFDGAGFSQDAFQETLVSLLADAERLAQMSRAAAKLARPDAARDVVDECVALVAGGST